MSGAHDAGAGVEEPVRGRRAEPLPVKPEQDLAMFEEQLVRERQAADHHFARSEALVQLIDLLTAHSIELDRPPTLDELLSGRCGERTRARAQTLCDALLGAEESPA